ncbi:unnamed protein product, partial [Staurois parvus]
TFGSPAGTASSGKAVGTESPGTTAGLSQLARQRAPDQVRIIWINSGHRVNWPNRIIRLDQFIMLERHQAE